MRVIVGDPEHQTPLFSDEMTYVVFSPYWNIPPDILREETLPRVVSDPDYLQRNNIEVVGTSGKGEVVDPDGHRLVGRGGDEGSALPAGARPRERARAREVHLPEPLQRLPARHAGRRAVLQGDARPQSWLHPRRAARWRSRSTCCAIGRSGPSRASATAMAANEEQTVTLKQPLRVHIGYWTAWVEPDGKTVTFTDDPYGIDPKHAALRARTSPIAVAAGPVPSGRELPEVCTNTDAVAIRRLYGPDEPLEFFRSCSYEVLRSSSACWLRRVPASAHPAPFSYLDVVVRDDGIEGILVLHVVDVAHELGMPEDAVPAARRRGTRARIAWWRSSRPGSRCVLVTGCSRRSGRRWKRRPIGTRCSCASRSPDPRPGDRRRADARCSRTTRSTRRS